MKSSNTDLLKEASVQNDASKPAGALNSGVFYFLKSTVWWIGVALKIGFASILVIGLLVAYGLRFSVITIGPFTLGLYGVVILADFITQTTCAYGNRLKVQRISNKAEARREAPLDISVAVVGYREDSEAWKKCLHSLQKQEAPPKAIIGVVDGQDEPDKSMAEDFRGAFPEGEVLIADFPELLSKLYTTTYWANIPAEFHCQTWKAKASRLKRSIGNLRLPCEYAAEQIAWEAVHNKLDEWNKEFKIDHYKAVCFSQPHGHKRTAMFTAFSIAMHIFKTEDAVFTTDSDTLLDPSALRHMSYLLASDSKLGGVTGDVKIWNKNESWLALMCALRYWFAFNVERACQSWFQCVTCISGPIGLYRVSDMRVILGPWVLQRFLGRDCTFGDDRHLTNRLLGEGRQTGYTHLAFCESDSPAGFVRWVKQQTRWSKSFFREAFWMPAAFAHQSVWLSVETLKQTLYPFILVSTVFQFLYHPTTLLRPVFWLGTLFGVALIKSVYGFVVAKDPSLLLFTFYGLFYFFGLLPSKIFALLTINVTAWGTSARSSSERARRESLFVHRQCFLLQFAPGLTFWRSYSGSRNSHVVHLLIWFTGLGVGFMLFFRHHFTNPLFWTVPVIVPVAAACVWPFWDLVQHDLVFFSKQVAQSIKSRLPARKGRIALAAGNSSEEDLEKGVADDHAVPIPMMDLQTPSSMVDPSISRLMRPTMSRHASTDSVSTVASSIMSDARPNVPHPVVDPFGSSLSLANPGASDDTMTRPHSPISFPPMASSRPGSPFGGHIEKEGALMSRPPMNRRRSAAKTLAEEAAREVRSMPGLPAGYHLQQRTLSAYGSLEDIGESMERADETPLRTDEAETTRSKRRTPFSVSGSRPSSRESRKSSLSGSRPSSRDSRKSSVWSIDSVATLTDNGTALERRPSHFLLRRASSNASAGAASSWSRASTVTLVETPLPTAKRHPSQLRQSHLSKSHKQSSSSCIKNSFSKNDTKQPSSLKLVTTEDSESEGHPLPNAEDMAAFQNALDKVDLQVRDQVKEGYKHINIRDPRPVSREA